MKKLTLALLSLMLFLGLGTAFAQDDDFGGGSGEITMEVPTLDPASGVVKPGATIDAKFSDEFLMSLMKNYEGTYGTAFVLYVENDAATTLESDINILMAEVMKYMMGGEEDDDEESLPYHIAVYGMDPESDPDDPDDYAGFMKWYTPITVSAEGDIVLRARVAVVSTGDGSVMYSEEFTADYTTLPQLSLSPMTLAGEVGKNAAVVFSIDAGVNFFGRSIAMEQMYPAAVYYTTDGSTTPSKEAFEAQSGDGPIKKVENETEEEDGDIYVVVPDNGQILPVVFDGDCNLKAIGYYSEDGEEYVATALFDKQIKVKAAAAPVFAPADVVAFEVGDKLVIKNPEPAPGEDDEDYWDYNEDDGTRLYFSFDGTTPSADDYYAQEEYSIFRSKAGQDIEMTFGQDAQGLYAYVPEIMGYNSPYDKIRLPENGQFTFKVVTVSYMETGKEVQSPWGTQPEIMAYGSDIIEKTYTVTGLTLPTTVTKPTFVPAPEAGALTKGDAIKWTMDAAYAKFQGKYGLSAVAYVVNGTDNDLNITAAELDELLDDYAAGYQAGSREEGKVYLYEEEKDAFQIRESMDVKARQIVVLSLEGETEDEFDIQIALSEIVNANYTVDASKLQKPTFKAPLAGSTVEPGSPIMFEIPAEYDWTAYTNLAYILYVENNDDVVLEGTAGEIMTANEHGPVASAKASGYKVVECALMGDDLSWTNAFIETESGALKIRARLAGINPADEVFYSDEITVSCTVAKGEGPGDNPQNPDLPETVKAPTFVPAAGEVEKGTAVTWTWDEAYNEETYPLIAVAYVVNGTDADLDITVENFGELWEASQEEDETTVREEGITYLYRTDVDDAYPYHIEKAGTVKARLLIGVLNTETGEVELALSAIVEAAYTVKGEPSETVATPTFSVAAGEVEKGTKVSIACETEDAVIYYTVDGSEPTAESTEYKEAIEINEAMTIKAIAIKGEAKSEVATAAYTVETANEDLELAGVSVFPNPSNGQFNLELPVAATVEVFMSNGMLYQRLTLAAGTATLNIERSGIYFLRIAGEGRTTVKRLIVR